MWHGGDDSKCGDFMTGLVAIVLWQYLSSLAHQKMWSGLPWSKTVDESNSRIIKLQFCCNWIVIKTKEAELNIVIVWEWSTDFFCFWHLVFCINQTNPRPQNMHRRHHVKRIPIFLVIKCISFRHQCIPLLIFVTSFLCYCHQHLQMSSFVLPANFFVNTISLFMYRL